MSKNTIEIGGFFGLLLLVLSGWAILTLQDQRHTKLHTTDQLALMRMRAMHQEDSANVSNYRMAYAKMNDSLWAFKVENGRLSIELNRKTIELLEANSRYAKQREEKQVEKALSICDSIVYKYVPEYLAVDTVLHATKDSTAALTELWVQRQNNIIDLDFKREDSVWRLAENERRANLEGVKTAKKVERKRLLRWGVVGAAIGALLTAIFGN
jgi:hypothetical protein